MKIKIIIQYADVPDKGKEQVKTIEMEAPNIPYRSIEQTVQTNLQKAHREATGLPYDD